MSVRGVTGPPHKPRALDLDPPAKHAIYLRDLGSENALCMLQRRHDGITVSWADGPVRVKRFMITKKINKK